MSSTTILCIDARNVLYNAVFASQRVQPGRVPIHPFVIMLKRITAWLHKFHPKSVHVFWDVPRNTVWRREIYPGYKDRSNSTHISSVTEELLRSEHAARELFALMNVRQFLRAKMEADDLIYAACVELVPEDTMVVTTDSDAMQIPFMLRNVQVYNYDKDVIMPIPICHPAMQKALTGDKADTVEGYTGIGKKKSQLLLESPSALQAFLAVKGRAKFIRNLLLVDLSLCPQLLQNRLYIRRVLAESVCFSKQDILRLADVHKLRGLHIEYANVVTPFQRLT